MIKIRFVNMHMNRDVDINSPRSREEDKAWMDGFNNTYTLTHDYTYKDLQFVMDDYDYLVVIDCVYKQFDNNGNKINYFDESKAVIFQAEPYALRSRFPTTIYDETDYDKRFIKRYMMNVLWGWLGYNIEQLMTWDFSKTKTISTIISSNQGIDGHYRRLLFLRDYLSTIDIDHYGDERGAKGCFSNDSRFAKNYKGYIEAKRFGISDYKYSFNAENCREIDYFSEKLTDIYLCETVPIYDGCLNIEKYFSPKSYISVNLDDMEQALYIIKRSIRENEYEKKYEFIKQEKMKIINELNPLELIYKAIMGKKNYWE